MNEKFTILHTADWHVCDDFIGDAVSCLEFMVNQADRIKPDLIVISGDIYNSRQLRQESEAARVAFMIIRRLARVAPVCILLGTPSHDGNAPLLIESINETCPVWIASTPTSTVLNAEPFGVKNQFGSPLEPSLKDTEDPIAFISAVPAFTKQYFQSSSDIATSDQEIAQELGALFAQFGQWYHDFNIQLRRDPDKKDGPIPHILLGHWSMGGAFIHPSQAITGLDIEIAREHVELANPTIGCFGHIHAQQKIGKNLFYSGSLFATDYGEMEAKGFYVHVLELVDYKDHWEVAGSEFIHTPSPLLIKISSDLLMTKHDDTATLVIMAALKGLAPNPNSIIRHDVKIYQDMAHTIDEDLIKKHVAEKLNPRKFDLNISRIPRPNVRSARVLEVDILRDKLQARADIINEPIDERILIKADVLESAEPEEIFDSVQKGVQL
jgi:DNA repair exonuclease SbcCD nuclease subunit